ncbi:DUF134 domain-containing protein [bacterium]|mgnify:CR=1 FL=1|jgi:uncharacterized protein|nr:DUF134 domain-containing protein [bacterium]MBT3581532.1 DUF134 domain-containing protein [bacterium]MBT4551512.1 DUF134 domain-containing protein [bacterium]MBT7087520.1 DUF134 domain-containing protein [bacterium]
MPFEKKHRCCRPFNGVRFFKPQGIPLRGLEILRLERDELEAIHLCDYEGLNQAEAAKRMKISTGTLQRLLYSGHKKIADALYESKALQIVDTDYISPN